MLSPFISAFALPFEESVFLPISDCNNVTTSAAETVPSSFTSPLTLLSDGVVGADVGVVVGAVVGLTVGVVVGLTVGVVVGAEVGVDDPFV